VSHKQGVPYVLHDHPHSTFCVFMLHISVIYLDHCVTRSEGVMQ